MTSKFSPSVLYSIVLQCNAIHIRIQSNPVYFSKHLRSLWCCNSDRDTTVKFPLGPSLNAAQPVRSQFSFLCRQLPVLRKSTAFPSFLTSMFLQLSQHGAGMLHYTSRCSLVCKELQYSDMCVRVWSWGVALCLRTHSDVIFSFQSPLLNCHG